MENIEVQEYDLEAIEQYNNLMDVFKGCFKNEVINLIKECREEILQTREYIRIMEKENQDIFEDNTIMAKQLYVCERLQDINSDVVKEKIKSILLSSDADMKFMDLEQIDNIFEIVLGEKEING